MELHEELYAAAAGQHGLLKTSQLRELGVSPQRQTRWIQVGRLIVVRRGVYRLRGAPDTWRSKAMAAQLAAGDRSVLSHTSAGVLWGLLDHRAQRGTLELTGPTVRRLERVRFHRHYLDPRETTVRHSIPVTTAERTLLDLGERFGPELLGRLVDVGMRRRTVRLDEMGRLADEHAGRGRPRLEAVRSVLADRREGYDPGANDWELSMDRHWDDWGLPPAERQHAIHVGRRIYVPDRAIVDLKVAVDWNGYEYHGSRSRFDHDSRRRAELAAAGWFPLDFTSQSSPELICQTVLSVVDQRRRLLGLHDRSA